MSKRRGGEGVTGSSGPLVTPVKVLSSDVRNALNVLRHCKGEGKKDYCLKVTRAVHGWCTGCVRERQWMRSGNFTKKKAKYDSPTFETLDEVLDFYRKLPS